MLLEDVINRIFQKLKHPLPTILHIPGTDDLTVKIKWGNHKYMVWVCERSQYNVEEVLPDSQGGEFMTKHSKWVESILRGHVRDDHGRADTKTPTISQP